MPGPSLGMNSLLPEISSVTDLETVLATLLGTLTPVPPSNVPVEQALGRIAAEMPPLAEALPRSDVATVDGWAVRSLDLPGASAYSPVLLAGLPVRVEVGDPMPADCDCVLDAELVDLAGPLPQAFAEAIPGRGMRRAGEDLAAGNPPLVAGQRLRSIDLLVARAAGLVDVPVRVPRVRVIDIAAARGETLTTRFVIESLAAAGAVVSAIETVGRDPSAITAALHGSASDLLILIGGTGRGSQDAVGAALEASGSLLAHTIAIQPGSTTAIGRVGTSPVIALPGAPDQAFGAYLALVRPVLDRLSGRSAPETMILPLTRKIASTVGIAEIVLVAKEQQSAWTPLAIGDLSLDSIRQADAWILISGDSEGFAAGTSVAAFPLRDFM